MHIIGTWEAGQISPTYCRRKEVDDKKWWQQRFTRYSFGTGRRRWLETWGRGHYWHVDRVGTCWSWSHSNRYDVVNYISHAESTYFRKSQGKLSSTSGRYGCFSFLLNYSYFNVKILYDFYEMHWRHNFLYPLSFFFEEAKMEYITKSKCFF